jgi:DNA-binding HxlR family transcriptional regulator
MDIIPIDNMSNSYYGLFINKKKDNEMENKDAYKMARNTDPDTSIDAAISIDPTKMEKIVLEAVSQFRERGATMSEIERMLVTIHPASISPRFKPLIEKGLIKVDDRTRKSVRSNRQQRIHWATEFYNEDS